MTNDKEIQYQIEMLKERIEYLSAVRNGRGNKLSQIDAHIDGLSMRRGNETKIRELCNEYEQVEREQGKIIEEIDHLKEQLKQLESQIVITRPRR